MKRLHQPPHSGRKLRARLLAGLSALALLAFTGSAVAQPLTITGPQDPNLDLQGTFVVAEYYGGVDHGPLAIGNAVFVQNNARLWGLFTGSSEQLTPSFGAGTEANNLALISDSDLWNSSGFDFSVPTVSGHSYKLQLLFHDNYYATTGSRLFSVTVGGQLVADRLDLAGLGASQANPVDVVVVYSFVGDGNPLSIQLGKETQNPMVSALTLEDTSGSVAPLLSVTPTAQTAYAGHTAVFQVVAGGTAPLTYQWQSGPSGGPYANLVDGAGCAGAATATLLVSNLSSASALDYQVIVSNTAGTVTSVPVSLTVLTPPPAISPGTNYAYAILTNNPFAYWRLNDSPSTLPVFDYAPGMHDGVLGSGASLGTTGPQSPSLPGFESDNSALATLNGAIPTLSLPALNLKTNQVTLLAWLNPSGGGNLAAGIVFCRSSLETAGLCYSTVQDANLNYTLSYQWTNGNVAPAAGWNSGLVVPAGIWSMVALVITPSNATLYVCNANGMNSATRTCAHPVLPLSDPTLLGNDAGHEAGARVFSGSIDEVAFLTRALTADQVLGLYGKATGVTQLRPTISGQPTDANVNAGATVRFDATAVGTPPLSFQWQAGPFHGGPYTNVVNGGNISGAQTSSLVLSNVAVANQAEYILVVSNKNGAVSSSPARLRVSVPLPTALIGRWLSGAANLADTSGFTPGGVHDGMVVGTSTPQWRADDVPPGYSGSSLYLDGACAVAITNTARNDWDYRLTFDNGTANRFSVAFWAKGYPAAAWYPFVSKCGETPGGWQIRDDSAGKGNNPTFSLRGTAGDDDGKEGAPLNIVDGNWHQYTATWDGQAGVRRLYVDGVAVINMYGDQGPMLMGTNSHIVLGARENNATLAAWFTGQLFDVRLYSYALNAGEVQALVTPPPANSVALSLSSTNPLPLGRPVTLSVLLPAGANLSSPVTVWVTNNSPSVVSFQGTSGNVVAVTFAAGGPTIQTLTLNTVGLGPIQLSVGDNAGLGGTLLNGASVVAPRLIGQWLTGTTDLADKSGFTPAGTHDGAASSAGGIGAATALFTNDVPGGFSGQSLLLDGTYLVSIANSSTTEAGYRTTFDDDIALGFSVSFWAKGTLGQWNPWVCKRGESSYGWGLRQYGATSLPCFTMRWTGDVVNDDTANSTTFLYDNATNWHHFTATWDGVTGLRRLYIDGRLDLTAPNDFGPLGMAKLNFLTLGGQDNNDSLTGTTLRYFFKGQLFDVRFFNYALNGSEILNLLQPADNALRAAADSPNIDQGHTGTVSVSLPAGANATQAVTVWVTNLQPSLVSLAGAGDPVVALNFPAGAPASQTLTLMGLSRGQAPLVFGASGLTPATVTVRVNDRQLVGRWCAGAQSLAESSGFTPAGTHDGVAVGTSPSHLAFVADVPNGFAGYSLNMDGTYAVRITNSSAFDSGYQTTFDDVIARSFTVATWIKAPVPTANWTALMSKHGDNAMGFQLRRYGSTTTEGFTLRETSIHLDDLGGSRVVFDSTWHHVAAVFDGYAGTRQVYVDGVLDPSINLTGDFGPFQLARNRHLVLGSEENLTILNPGYANSFLKGQLYEVRVYNYALSATELQRLLSPEQAPALTVQLLAGGTLRVSWPLSATGYSLQVSSSPLSGWVDAGLSVTPQGDSNVVTDSVNGAARFYRLRRNP